MQGVEFERSIDFGDILSSITIILSALGLFVSIDANTRVQSQKLDEERRDSAAQVIVSSDQYIEADRSLFDRLQPVFVETSRIAVERQDPAAARDYYWKSITEIKSQVATEIAQKEISTSYQKLMIYDPASRGKYRMMFRKMRQVEQKFIDKILVNGQQLIFEFEGRADASPAILGNELRNMTSRSFDQFLEEAGDQTRQDRKYFCKMIYKEANAVSECAEVRS